LRRVAGRLTGGGGLSPSLSLASLLLLLPSLLLSLSLLLSSLLLLLLPSLSLLAAASLPSAPAARTSQLVRRMVGLARPDAFDGSSRPGHLAQVTTLKSRE
jgi:hypothetical protein